MAIFQRLCPVQEYTVVEWRSVAHFLSSWRGVQSKPPKPYVCTLSHGSYTVDLSATDPLGALDMPRCQPGYFLVAFRIWLGAGSSSSMVALFHVPEQLPGTQHEDAAVHLRKEEVQGLKGFGNYQQGKCSQCDTEHSNGEMKTCACGFNSFCKCACFCFLSQQSNGIHWHPCTRFLLDSSMLSHVYLLLAAEHLILQ